MSRTAEGIIAHDVCVSILLLTHPSLVQPQSTGRAITVKSSSLRYFAKTFRHIKTIDLSTFFSVLLL